MLGKNIVRKFVTLTTLATIWCVYSMVALAVSPSTTGEITVTGQVTVNGQPAVSTSTITSGSTVTTAKGSSAVVSLGKLGRVEIQEDSSLTLNFSDTSVIAMLDSGKVRISANVNVATTVTTKHTTVIGDSAQANNFVVETACANTYVDTTSGAVTMREGSSDKQVVAGTSAMAGTMGQPGCKPCLRPNSTPGPAFTGWPWLLLVAGGAAAAATYFGRREKTTNFGGTGSVVSPTR
ncbi:MAG: hypothetical protein ACKVQJ_04620 [Pyrinomonadaceae bacterium]